MSPQFVRAGTAVCLRNEQSEDVRLGGWEGGGCGDAMFSGCGCKMTELAEYHNIF